VRSTNLALRYTLFDRYDEAIALWERATQGPGAALTAGHELGLDLAVARRAEEDGATFESARSAYTGASPFQFQVEQVVHGRVGVGRRL
jgi:hypothetical protein